MSSNHYVHSITNCAQMVKNKVALRFGNSKITYTKLDALSNHLAFLIWQQCNISPGQYILVEANKSITTIVTIIAILKLRCCYVPIDPNTPTARCEYLESETKTHVTLYRTIKTTLSKKNNLQSNLLQKIDFEITESSNLYENCKLPFKSEDYNLDDLAYCLFTSGSSGVPKGVVITHRAMRRFYTDINQYMNINQNSECLNTSPFFFDVSILDTLYPLTRGATVTITPEIKIPQYCLSLIEKYHITHFCAVSSTLNLLAGSQELLEKYNISSLEVIMSGAELLNHMTLKRIIECSPTVKIINGYGPTEVTCVCIAFVIDKSNVDDYSVYPIGKPLTGISAKILDEHDHEVDKGELMLAGEQLMKNYINASVTSHFKKIGENIYYYTGDIVSYDSDNQLIFHCRKDSQIKLNGYRIDLNEIKYHLLKHEQLIDMVMCVVDNSLCVAYICNSAIESELKNILKKQLPNFMQPSNWKRLVKFPKLSNGKINTNAITLMFQKQINMEKENAIC